MNFLYPIGLFFTLFIPAVIVLYLLKLKRIDQPIASTFLWRKSLEDLKANTPFQKLKRNLLLFLQLLIITLLTLVVARPVLRLGGLTGQSLVVLIDHSASMASTDISPNRLAEAKEKAIQLVNDMGQGDRMMVVAFSNKAQVLSPFEQSKGALRNVIREIQPTDNPTNIQDAIKVAESAAELQPNLEVYIFSDGKFDLAEDSSLAALTTHYISIGESSGNVAITDLVVRRDYTFQSEFEVLVGLQNLGSSEKETYVELMGNIDVQEATGTASTSSGELQLLDARRLSLAPGASEQIIFKNPPAYLDQIEVRLDCDDYLKTDNQAWAIIPHQETMEILLVTEHNQYLQRVLNLDPQVQLSVTKPGSYQGPGEFDLVVFDTFSPPALVSGNYIFINAIPPIPNWSSGESVENPMIVDWDRFHPLTRYVNLDNLSIRETHNIAVPGWVEVIAESRQTPLIVAYEQNNTRALVTAFDIFQSNWPLRVSFPIFFMNAIEWFRQGKDVDAFMKQTGDVIVLEPPEELSGTTQIIGPDGKAHPVTFSGDQPAYFGESGKVGIYEYQKDGETLERYAVNLLSIPESTISPVSSLTTGSAEIVTDPASIEANREIWKTLALFALLVLCIEWFYYTKRARYAF